VASFTIASTPRRFDHASNAWKDGETLLLRCSIWRQDAENVSESLTRGTRVVAQGRLKQRSLAVCLGMRSRGWLTRAKRP
jgi:single-strand DNA-binding protein